MVSNEARAARREVLEKIRPRAERELNDRRLDPWRGRGRRRALVVSWAAMVAGLATVILVWNEPVLTLVAVVACFGLAWTLRRLVRGMADLPAELVDERMLAVRNRAYWLAYSGLVGVVSLALVAAFFAMDARRIGWQPSALHLEAALWTFMFLAGSLPSAIIAWTEEEV